ncbi:MAG: hypothetical protein OER88_03525 [Planctomycetota bacterium]|nr:hypothetical protein [Planctomycetota bacterium]
MEAAFAGSVVLQRGDRFVTLVWSKDEKDRRRALPAGAYQIKTTRIVRENGDGWWFLSSTGPARAKVSVEETSGATLDIGDTVHFKAMAKAHGKKLQLGFGITGRDGRGLSVYKNGKRVPVRYKLVNKNGKTIGGGAMNYG